MLEREPGNIADKVLEQLVFGDEIRLRIDLDDSAAIAFDGYSDEAFGRRATSLLGRRCETLRAQPVDRGLHFAIGLGERLLAVHHSGAGALAQFLDTRGRDLSHVFVPLFSPTAWGGGRAGGSAGGGYDSPTSHSPPASGRGDDQASSACSTGGSAISPMSSPSPSAGRGGPRSLAWRPRPCTGGSRGWRRRCRGQGTQSRSDPSSNRGSRRPE